MTTTEHSIHTPARPPRFSALGRDMQIRGVRFRNRMVQAPMCAMYAAPDGSATRQNVEYYRARAAGGAGLVIVEITFTDDGGSRAFHAQLGAHDDRMIPGLADIAEAVRAEGAVAGLQLGHCGAQRVVSESPIVAPSPIPWAPGKRVPVELTREEIAQLVQDHADATRRAVQAGFQLLELHAAHGYLVNAFLSPATNTRQDEFGGNFENRLRFAREVLGVMRAQLGPKRLLCARLNGDDLLSGGLGIEDYHRVARALAETGLDMIHVSAGTYRVMEKRIPPMYLTGETFAKYAGGIRAAANLPVIASGTIHDPVEANRLVADGEADFVSMARPLFADPALPAKLLYDRSGEVLPCIRCNTCLAREQGGARGYCAINPRTGREHEPPSPRSDVKTIGIIGGGPAGIQAALSAAERGHRVTLWERQERVGGQLRLAAMLPFKKTLSPLLEYYEAALARAAVVVRCNASVSPDELNDDVVLLATGPAWGDARGPNFKAGPIIDAAEALRRGGEAIGSRVLVVGAGLTGAELAWALASDGRQITLVERDDDFDEDVNVIAKIVLTRELARVRIDLRFGAEFTRLANQSATVVHEGQTNDFEVDTVISTIRRPAPPPLPTHRKPTMMIGESSGRRGLLEATLSGYRAALAT